MKTCDYEKYMLPYLYGELEEKQHRTVHDHLKECPHCRTLFDEVAEVHQLLTHRKRAKIPRNLYRTFVRQLREYFAPSSTYYRDKLQSALSFVFQSRSLTLRVARVMAVLAIGVIIGRFWLSPKTMESTAPEQGQSLAVQDVKMIHEYIVQSELFLLTIANSSVEQTRADDILLNKSIAEDLLAKSLTVQRKADRLDDEMILTFLTHLELILLDITNRDEQQVRSTFQEIRELVHEANMIQQSRRLQDRLQPSLQKTI